MKVLHKSAGSLIGLCAVATSAQADQAAELAKQLSNPIAPLISVPFQLNYNDGFGADEDGEQWLLNIQPVIPFSLNDDWNLITRTIIPVISNDGVIPDSSKDGLGNILFSTWASPKEPTANGWIWGVGAAGRDDQLECREFVRLGR